MGTRVVDYRVSTLIVLCKDCGNDVGLYPARHKCTPVNRPIMPPLPLDLTDENLSPSNNTIDKSSGSPSINRWRSQRENNVSENTEDSIYFNNFAQNLPESSNETGKKLWGKVRQNDKWRQLSEKNEKPNQSGKLWGKLLQATQTMSEKTQREDRGAESDEDDWEGETHVARILREHYEKNRQPLPHWLFDDRAPKKIVERESITVPSNPIRTPSRRRLWENNIERGPSVREKERMELRQQKTPPPVQPEQKDDYYRRPSLREQPFERHSYNTQGQFYKERQEYEKDRGSMPPRSHRNGYYEEEGTIRNYDKMDDYYRVSSPPLSSSGSLRRAPDAGRSGLRINNYF